MPEGPKLSAGDFGAAFKGFLEEAVTTAPAPDPFFRARLTAHFGVAPTTLPIVAEQFPPHDHPNLQLALDDEVAATEGTTALLGVAAESRRMMGVALGDLVAAARPGLLGGGPIQEGPVEWINRPSGDDEVLPCVQFGLYLFEAGRENGAAGRSPLAVLVRGADQRSYMAQNVTVEAMAPEREVAERFLSRLRNRMRRRNVYRGRIVSLSKPAMGPLEVRFHQIPDVRRDRIVLPDGVLERIERQTIRFAHLRDRLSAAGRHLKRGVLLWGPPGTGKTLTAMYLARQMPDRTVLLLTGQTFSLIATSCTMARLLQPATVILEDVDLVAEERTNQSTGTNTVLFELLNQMDGLGDDADVLFVLTSNRPELLEPALAARPGRVDEAIEIPLPDAGCRSRLLDLYQEGLDLELDNRDAVVARTEGVSAAFIKELLRKAAVYAADASAGEGITVTDEHLDQALLDLMVEGGRLTRSLLGVDPGRAVNPDCG
jgi:hypothetical protein